MLLTNLDKLRELVKEADAGFEDAFERMVHFRKEDMRPFLTYVDKVLNYELAREKTGLRCTHLHFPELPAALKDALLEFLVIRTFYRSLEKDLSLSSYVPERISSLRHDLSRNQLPADARGANGGNLVYRNWLAKKERVKEELILLLSIDPQKSLWPDTIFNILNNDLPILEESLFAMTVEDLERGVKRTYNLLNAELPIEGLIRKLYEHGRLRSIRQVILFDCDTRRTSYAYNQRTLGSMIQRNYPIKDLVLLSFDKRPFRMRSLINRLSTVYRRYLLPPQQNLSFNESHVVEQEELDQLVSATHNTTSIHWIGEKSELFIDYSDLVVGYGIGRLRLPSILNIYAAAINKGCAGAIIADLFGDVRKNYIFDDETREGVKALYPHEQEILKAAVSGLLQLVILEWTRIKLEMRKYMGKGSVGMVIPFTLIESSFFRRELKAILSDRKVNIYTWKDMRDEKCKDKVVFILTYRDPGRYPFDLYPSLLERHMDDKVTIEPLLLRMFFGDRYDRCLFSYQQVKMKILHNEFRYKFLDWKGVEARLQASKPPSQEETSIEEEDNDVIMDVSESVKVDYHDDSRATFYPSRLLIIREKKKGCLAVKRADGLPEDAVDWAIQPLDELYEDLNLFQITPGEEKELQLIKEMYHVSNLPQALWKVLLVQRLSEERNSRVLYEKIEHLLREKEFVRYEHFKEHWLNIKSELLIPRKRKHFRLMCDYLGMPPAYYRLMLKKRASMVMNSRHSNLRMNGLLSQMINEGLFEPGIDWAGRDLRHLMKQHGLEDKGIDEDNLQSELESLVDLLQEKIQLKEVKKIERS